MFVLRLTNSARRNTKCKPAILLKTLNHVARVVAAKALTLGISS